MGRSAREFRSVKAMVLTAMPSASVATATTVNAGAARSARIAYRKSFSIGYLRQGRKTGRPVSCLLRPVSCLLSPVSCLLSPGFHLCVSMDGVSLRPGRLTAFVLAAFAAAAGMAGADQGAAPSPLPTLTTISAIRALSQDEGARGYPVRVRGIVTHLDERADVNLIIHDGRLGQWVVPPTDPSAIAAWRELRRGDLVEVEGRTVRG